VGGVGLSAGQSQRIALARALFGDPCVLIFDEPNAHLDSDGELLLDAAVMKLRAEGRAIIVAAHRSNLLRAANRLLLIRDGRLEAFSGLEDRPRTVEGLVR
jgi:ATP-binding cassette subfamily C protein